MSGFRPFTRQLGMQPGIQLNPLADQTDGTVPDQSDQVIATVARLTRGRIDRPFRVTRNNFIAKTGPAEAMRVNALNEAKLQVYEALNQPGGAAAASAVIQRLVPAAAAKSYAVVNFSGTPTETASTVAYSVSTTAPTAGYSLYVLDHECHNDGIKLSLHANKTPLGGTAVANKEITLRVLDSTGRLRYEFAGSLDENAKDDYGASLYLPDVVNAQTDNIELVVAAGAQVPVTSNAYGRSLSGADNWATSETLVCFTEGGTTYTNDDFDRCVTALRNTMLPFGYVISGGSQSVPLVTKLGTFAIEANLPIKIDVPGTLAPSAAITWRNQFAFDSHYVHFNWAPLEADDPMNGGKAKWGTGGLQAAFSCGRNARVNALGFAPKNFPVAGKEWPVTRSSVRQNYTPDEQELSDLAEAQINPVIYENYNGGGRYVFTDSLTAAKTRVSRKKLQSVSEMSASMDNWIALQAKEWLQLPMQLYIKNMSAFLDLLLQRAQASDWLVPSQTLPGNAAYAFEVIPDATKPADTVVINYFTSYDGVVRQGRIQQTLAK